MNVIIIPYSGYIFVCINVESISNMTINVSGRQPLNTKTCVTRDFNPNSSDVRYTNYGGVSGVGGMYIRCQFFNMFAPHGINYCCNWKALLCHSFYIWLLCVPSLWLAVEWLSHLLKTGRPMTLLSRQKLYKIARTCNNGVLNHLCLSFVCICLKLVVCLCVIQ